MRAIDFIILLLLPFLLFSKSIAASSQQFDRVDAYERSNLRARRSWVARARDSIIEFIWNVPAAKPACFHAPIRHSQPPNKLLARYGGDVVLRFRIVTEEEAKALSEAIQVLFLDVWESTSEWVDIRLSKDIVCVVTQNISPMLTMSLAGPLAPWTPTAITSDRPHTTYA